MKASTEQIREDFDQTAMLPEHGGPLDAYYGWLLRHLPPQCESALEIGCGTGSFTRRLATSARKVTGLDLSPQMIHLAREQSADYPNIEYLIGDLLQLAMPEESFGFVISIATLHHLPAERALLKIKSLLAPGSLLIIHDLIADNGLLEMCRSALAAPLNLALRFLKTGRPWPRREVRAAWAAHGQHDVYLTLAEVKKLCEQFLPGAQIRHHLLWRYTIIWRRPSRPE